jgi:hypothetical protein
MRRIQTPRLSSGGFNIAPYAASRPAISLTTSAALLPFIRI